MNGIAEDGIRENRTEFLLGSIITGCIVCLYNSKMSYPVEAETEAKASGRVYL